MPWGMWEGCHFNVACYPSTWPLGPYFRLVRLPRKGQAQVSQKLEAHILGLTNRNDEEMHAGSNQSLQHSGARGVRGTFFCLLKSKGL